MSEEDELQPEDAPEIADRAFEALNSYDLETAQELALQLEKLHFSAYFEIQALIHLKQDDPVAAIEILREGVSKAAAAWPLWELLGNCLSDNGDFDEALTCYTRGLELDIDEEAKASLQFNLATVLSRMGKHSEAWAAGAEISDEVLQEYPALRWHVEGLRLRTLAALGQCQQVIERANHLEDEAANEEDEDNDNAEVRAIFWEQGGRALLQCGEVERAYQWAREALNEKRTHAGALQLLRDATPDLPQASRYFQVLLEGDALFEDGEEMGFITSYEIVARVAEEAEQLALQMEAPRWETPVHVMECEFQGESESQSIGIFHIGGYGFFPRNEDEDENEDENEE